MNLKQFESQLKKIDKDFRIRKRGDNGIGGIFKRNDFLVTISHGHIPLQTMRYIFKQGDRLNEKIKKRGRSEVSRILTSRRSINRDQSVKLKYGLL